MKAVRGPPYAACRRMFRVWARGDAPLARIPGTSAPSTVERPCTKTLACQSLHHWHRATPAPALGCPEVCCSTEERRLQCPGTPAGMQYRSRGCPLRQQPRIDPGSVLAQASRGCGARGTTASPCCPSGDPSPGERTTVAAASRTVTRQPLGYANQRTPTTCRVHLPAL